MIKQGIYIICIMVYILVGMLDGVDGYAEYIYIHTYNMMIILIVYLYCCSIADTMMGVYNAFFYMFTIT